MIPMSSRWQNFPDRHLRRVLYPGGREQQGFGFPGQPCCGECDATPAPGAPQGLHVPCQGLLVPGGVSISIPRAVTATAAATSSRIPAPGPWLIPLIPRAKEAPDLDHSKDQGNPWVRAQSC